MSSFKFLKRIFLWGGVLGLMSQPSLEAKTLSSFFQKVSPDESLQEMNSLCEEIAKEYSEQAKESERIDELMKSIHIDKKTTFERGNVFKKGGSIIRKALSWGVSIGLVAAGIGALGAVPYYGGKFLFNIFKKANNRTAFTRRRAS
jgi:hypothetical protein